MRQISISSCLILSADHSETGDFSFGISDSFGTVRKGSGFSETVFLAAFVFSSHGTICLLTNFSYQAEIRLVTNGEGFAMGSIKTAPVGIIAVKDVVKTSKLLVELFGWKSMHGGSEFEILMDKKNVPMLMLHEFNAHEHRRFAESRKKSKGIGQSTYVFAEDIDGICKKVRKRKLKVIEPLFLNENSQAREFTFQIGEGYQFSVCEADKWLYYWV